jgi:hypothetical protein
MRRAFGSRRHVPRRGRIPRRRPMPRVPPVMMATRPSRQKSRLTSRSSASVTTVATTVSPQGGHACPASSRAMCLLNRVARRPQPCGRREHRRRWACRPSIWDLFRQLPTELHARRGLPTANVADQYSIQTTQQGRILGVMDAPPNNARRGPYLASGVGCYRSRPLGRAVLPLAFDSKRHRV